MAVKQNEKNPLYKGRAQFEVVGAVGKIGDWTYKIDEKSESGYQYSSARLKINVGDNNAISVEAMGGYNPSKERNVIKVRSKEDPKTRFDVEWEDRFNEEILETISDFDFITVALEKDTSDKLFYKKFLSMYDAVDYIRENLKEGMIVKVRGDISFSEYNENTQMRKNFNAIYLTAAAPEDYKATFTQTMLIDDKALDKSHAKDDKTIGVNAMVVDYDKSIRKQRPYNFTYYVVLEEGKEKAALAVVNKFLTVDKNKIREIIMEGNLFEGADIGEIQATEIPQDLQDLIDCGIYTKEEIIGKMAVRGNKVTKMFITKPYVHKNKEGVVQTFVDDNKYTPDDLFVTADEPEEVVLTDAEESVPFTLSNKIEVAETSSDTSWMSELGL